jgi:small GTP-binding protein
MSERTSRQAAEGQPATAFTTIGGPVAPGVTLRCVLRGHTDRIGRIAWSPDGRYLASPSWDTSVRIWDAETGACIAVLEGESEARTAAWSPDGRALATGYDSGEIRIWDAAEGGLTQVLQGPDRVNPLAWSPSGDILASGHRDDKIQLWDPWSGKLKRVLDEGHKFAVEALAWDPGGKILASGNNASHVCLWNPRSRRAALDTLETNASGIYSLAWSPDGKKLAFGTFNRKIEVWVPENDRKIAVIEEHTGFLTSVSFSSDGSLLASKGSDGYVILWRADTWEKVGILNASAKDWESGMTFNPKAPALAILGEEDQVVYILDLDVVELLGTSPRTESVHYTTAKLVLVGDSGVGKTGLGWRLAHGEFKEHASTHGQQFWPITQLGLKRKDGVECEAVLWDLAGQHVYRQIHSIFLENVAVALVVFDPSNRQEPLKGVQFWLEQLKGKGQLPPAVLVGARVDRGAPTLAQQELDQFCQRYGIRGGYISTSAVSGEGLDTLLNTLKAQIPWEEMTATVTTVTFKRIKDFVLALKEQPGRGDVLLSPSALHRQLQASDPGWEFTDDEMMTAVGHLETHGYVAVLCSSAGELHILLAPDLLVTVASSIVLLADKHPRELGAISENSLLQGSYPVAELSGLASAQSQFLLDAAILRFLTHNICFRETLGEETLLIFPGLIKQKRPLQDDLQATDDISYVVRGRVENLYASLVVLLGYTPSFTRINQWQNQAQYEMDPGEICGFRLIEDREGQIELVLYYADQMPADGRVKFQELFEQFLYQREVEVTPFPPVLCTNGHRQKRATVVERVRERKPFMFCDECGHKITLPDFETQGIGLHASPWLQREEATARLRSAYEVQLTRVKGYRRGWAVPRCYISRMPELAGWSEELIHDLHDAGVHVVREAAQVRPDDFLLILDTPAYQQAFKSGAPILAADAPLIRARLGVPEKSRLISLALVGRSGPHKFGVCEAGSFRDETHYPVSLFDLVLALYAIPLKHAGFAPLRQALHDQWEQTLAGPDGADVIAGTTPLRVFISYAREDEAFKDELVTMLAGLQRRGIVDAWEDRRIEAGEEWHKSIQDAMSQCDLAILLVSSSYLASRFIQEQEQPILLQRSRDMQLRVIPIVVRPCMWQSEPALKGLQALPKDGKAVITFAKENGERDQAWADIAAAIEERD